MVALATVKDAPSYVINPALYDNVPYDARKSFDPVTLAVSTTVVLAVHPSVPAQTVKDLVALIKANPSKYNYSTAGVGSPGHLVGEMLRQSGSARCASLDRWAGASGRRALAPGSDPAAGGVSALRDGGRDV